MLVLVVLAALSAGETEVSVALPGFTATGMDSQVVGGLTDRFASELGRAGVRVVSQRDLTQLLGLERQRELLGCAENASNCTAEIASALGVDMLVTVNLLQLGNKWTLTVRLLRTQNGAVLFSASSRLDSIEAVQDELDQLAKEVGKHALGPPAPMSTRWVPWAGVGLGAAAVVVGAVLFGASSADAATLKQVTRGSSVDVAAVRSSGETKEKLGLVFAGAGLAVAVASLVWALVRSPVTEVGVVLTPSGATVTFARAWP